jgi:hypothetical protein
VLNKDDRPAERVKIDAHNQLCFAGIARTSIKIGEIKRGVNIAKELQDNTVLYLI